MLGVESFEAVQETFRRAKGDLSEILSAFEFFDRQSFNLVLRHVQGAREPFDTQTPFYVLIETSGSNKDHDDEKLANFLESVLGDEVVADGVLAQDSTQAAAFWRMREGIPEACQTEGGNYKYDLSVPVPQLYSIVEKMREKLGSGGQFKQDGSGPVKNIIGFGHMGDGNLHLNITTSGYSEQLDKAIEPYVYELVEENAGSISAEHGLGLMKAPYLSYSKSTEMIAAMKRIKDVFDPKGILNPYKYFPNK